MKPIAYIILLICLFGCHARTTPTITGLEGKSLPAFTLLLNDSSSYLNTANIPSGKGIVLFYFSPECPYCRAEMDDIIKNIAALRDIRFYLFTTWPFPEMKSFYQHYQLDRYSNISVGVDLFNYFKSYYKTEGVPYVVVYDKTKKMKQAFLGPVYSDQILKVAEN